MDTSNVFVKRGAQILLIATVFFLGWYGGQESASSTVSEALESQGGEVAAAEAVTLMIDYGNGTTVSIPGVSLMEGNTVYDVLKTAGESKGIAVESKDYGGELGQFIQSIDGKQGSGDAYWQYWLNGIYSQKGVSGVAPASGDVIEFKLTKGQQGQ